ncbi:MAG: methyltransferase domain-containing protein [Dehalococcoidia bacterium]|nr:methyltransferase domain-containing protein [Dehalococcoidia bacterium]
MTTSTTGAWDPTQYARFEAERSRPFFDLAGMVERRPDMRVVDLGCGTGTLTAWLHADLQAVETLGVDASEEMLAQCAAHEDGALRFVAADTVDFAATRGEQFDLVFSNAALQWVDGHERLIPLVAGLVARGGQLAVQMPTNDDHTSHEVARTLARSEPFATALQGWVRPDPVRPPEWYAKQLYRLGFAEQRVEMRVYGHVLPEPRSVIEWVKGSLLSAYRARLDAETYATFLAAYEERLLEALDDEWPFFYPFKRILLWARRES